MICVPLHSIHCQVVTFIGLQILSTVGLGAEMDLSFLGTDQEDVILEFVEVEAHTTCQTVKEGLLLVLAEALVFVHNKLELDHLLSLELVFHELPVGNPTITGDGVEVKILHSDVIVPFHLPHRVSVLVSPHS